MLNSLLASVEMVLYFFHIPGMVMYWLMILESVFLAMPLPMQTVNLLHCSEEGMRESRLFRAVMGLWVVYLILPLFSVILLLDTSSVTGGRPSI